jgi:hypothetical protein
VAAAPAAPANNDALKALPTAPPANAPAAPPVNPAAILPYSQNVRFNPRNNFMDVPLGHSEDRNASVIWEINGARSANLEILGVKHDSGLYMNCPKGNTDTMTPSFTGKQYPLQLPKGEFKFSMPDTGLYFVKINVVKSDGSTTDIPFWFMVGCYKAF